MIRLLAVAFFSTLGLPVVAGDFAPGGNVSALARSFALPALGDSRVLKSGHGDFRATLDFTNEYVREGDCATECILLDGETSRLRLDYAIGLGHGWDLGAHLPLLSRGGGFLDSWIQEWHGWFGLPTGGREQSENGQYQYNYQRSGVTLLDVNERGNCVGDATLTVGRALGWDASLRGMAKLPTGDADMLCGGNAGGAIWLDSSLPLPAPWRAYMAAGYSLNARSDVIGGQMRRGVPFGGAAILLPLTDSVRIHAQLQLHGALYQDSAMTPLSRMGAPLTLGLNIRASKRIDVDLGFQEDPSVNGSPDFSAYASLRWK